MKKLGLLVVLLNCFFVLAYSQTNTFYRKYNIPGMQGGLGVVNMPDGGFVGIGQHEGSGSAGDCDVYAYKVDECGNLEWMKLMGTSAQEGGKSIYQRRNGNLLLVGLYNATGFLMELNINGNLIWEKRYNGISWSIAVTEDANNHLYVTGTTSSTGEYVVMHCDPTGNVIWSNVYNSLGQLPASIIGLPGNRFIVLAAYAVPSGDFALNCIDNAGNILWSKTYGGTGFSDTDHNSWGCKAILDHSGSNVMVVSQSQVLGSDNILLSKIELSSGNEVWTKVIGDGGSEQPRDIVLTDGGYAVLGNTNGFSMAADPAIGLNASMGERDILLVKVDEQGSKVWARTYGAEERDKGIGLRHNDDGSFLISAYTSSPYFGNTDISMDPLFIRTDTLGKVSCQVNTPNISVINYTLTTTTSGTTSPRTVSSFACNSIVSNYVPVDDYVCLSCRTSPIFVPSDTNVCVNDTVYFYNTTTIGLTCFQSWSLDGVLVDGSVDTISYSFSTPGVYPILLYSNCGTNTDTFRINIRVNPFPEPDFSVAGNCLRDTTRFTNLTTIPAGSVSAWEWIFSDNTVSSSMNPTHVYNAIGTYPITLSAVSDMGCRITANDTVTIHPLPKPCFKIADVCDRDTAHVVNISGGPFPLSRYDWTFSDGAISSEDSPAHLFPGPGHYYVGVMATDVHGCKENYFEELDVHELPKPSFSTIPPSCDYYSFAEFENTSANFIYVKWSFGDGDSSVMERPTHHYDTSGYYEVMMHVTSEKGCIDSLVQRVEVKESFNIWIPNAFTPNGDQINDRFIPWMKGVVDFNMEIYDRWGAMIFETANMDGGWDGALLNQKVQNDVFNYKIFVTDNCNDKHSYIGKVTLLK